MDAVPLDDPSAWDAAADSLITGPPGCWEVAGRASWNHDFGRWGGTRGDAVFSGRIVDGVWGEFEIWPTGEIIEKKGEEGPEFFDRTPRFTPMVGQVRGLRVSVDSSRELNVDRSDDPRVEAVNTVHDVLDALTDDVAVAYAVEQDDGVHLIRETTAGKKGAVVRTEARFDGSSTRPLAWDLGIDGTYVHKALVKVTEFEVRVRGRSEGELSLPTAEVLRFTLEMPMITVQARQTIAYKSVIPCAVGG